MIRPTRAFSLIAALFALGSAPLFAAAPYVIAYQGRLVNKTTGAPIAAPASLSFRIYNAASGGATLYTALNMPVSPSNGVFNVLIGDTSASWPAIPADLFTTNTGLWLEIQFGAESYPRQRLVASPYALAVAADSVGSAEIEDGSIANVDIASLSATKLTGNLPATVIASSIAVNAVTNGSIVSMSATKLTGNLPATVIASSVAVSAVGSSQISNGSIKNEDVSSSASDAIDASKVKGGTFATGGGDFLFPSGANVEMVDGYVVTKGLIFKTGGGNCYRVDVDNSGVLLGPTFTPCP